MRIVLYSFFIVFGILFNGCKEQQHQPIIKSGSKFIKPYYRNDYLRADNEKFQFELLEKIEYDLDGNGVDDIIRVLKLKNWEDPGDFHKVEILIDSKEFSFLNFEGWSKFNDANNVLKSNYISYINDGKHKVLVLNSFIYGAGPGLMSIIAIGNKKADLIFNDEYHIKNVQVTKDEIQMTINTKSMERTMSIIDNELFFN